jgi:hypothetical protein
MRQAFKDSRFESIRFSSAAISRADQLQNTKIFIAGGAVCGDNVLIASNDLAISYA